MQSHWQVIHSLEPHYQLLVHHTLEARPRVASRAGQYGCCVSPQNGGKISRTTSPESAQARLIGKRFRPKTLLSAHVKVGIIVTKKTRNIATVRIACSPTNIPTKTSRFSLKLSCSQRLRPCSKEKKTKERRVNLSPGTIGIRRCRSDRTG